MERSIVRKEVTILREDIRSELQSFYGRISTLIESCSVHRAPGPSSPLPPPSPPPLEAGKDADPIPGPSSPSSPASPPPPKAGKDADPTPGPPSPPRPLSPPFVDIAQIASYTLALADDLHSDMV